MLGITLNWLSYSLFIELEIQIISCTFSGGALTCDFFPSLPSLDALWILWSIRGPLLDWFKKVFVMGRSWPKPNQCLNVPRSESRSVLYLKDKVMIM